MSWTLSTTEAAILRCLTFGQRCVLYLLQCIFVLFQAVLEAVEHHAGGKEGKILIANPCFECIVWEAIPHERKQQLTSGKWCYLIFLSNQFHQSLQKLRQLSAQVQSVSSTRTSVCLLAIQEQQPRMLLVGSDQLLLPTRRPVFQFCKLTFKAWLCHVKDLVRLASAPWNWESPRSSSFSRNAWIS